MAIHYRCNLQRSVGGCKGKYKLYICVYIINGLLRYICMVKTLLCRFSAERMLTGGEFFWSILTVVSVRRLRPHESDQTLNRKWVFAWLYSKAIQKYIFSWLDWGNTEKGYFLLHMDMGNLHGNNISPCCTPNFFRLHREQTIPCNFDHKDCAFQVSLKTESRECKVQPHLFCLSKTRLWATTSSSSTGHGQTIPCVPKLRVRIPAQNSRLPIPSFRALQVNRKMYRSTQVVQIKDDSKW